MLANVSSGIEPNFSWVYTRNSCDQMLYVVHPLMESVLMSRDQYNDDILHKLAKGIPVKDIPELCDIGDHWITSQEIKQDEHIKIQAAFQAFTDNAVSKPSISPIKPPKTTLSKLICWLTKPAARGSLFIAMEAVNLKC